MLVILHVPEICILSFVLDGYMLYSDYKMHKLWIFIYVVFGYIFAFRNKGEEERE